MEENVYGIQETKDVFKAVQAGLATYQSLTADGSFAGGDYILFLTAVGPALYTAVHGADKIPAELSDLTDNEIQELRDEGYGPLLDNANVIKIIFGLSVAADGLIDEIKRRNATEDEVA